LLDADVFSYLMRPDLPWGGLYPPHVVGKAIAVSFITVGELLFGARKRNWGARKVADLRLRLRSAVILPYDLALCEAYGNLKAAVYSSGRVIADNDLWIAACALRHSVPLISNNRAHFEGIPGLVLKTEQQP
jgi:predicted nucleic acid-binding protein